MLQIAVLLVSIGLIVLGIKGFTASGIPVSKSFALKGTNGKIAGAICIAAGILFIPAFLLAFLAYGGLFAN